MRLSQSTLTDAKARLPDYDRDQVETGIIHLGIGAFHRAHQAVVIDDLLAQDPSWGIIGASLRSPKTADALNPQNGLYTLVSMQGQKRECRVIGSVCNVLAAQGDARELVAKMALPEIRVISLTVTEKGYCHVPATGQLDLSHPDVIHDLENPDGKWCSLLRTGWTLLSRCGSANMSPFPQPWWTGSYLQPQMRIANWLKR